MDNPRASQRFPHPADFGGAMFALQVACARGLFWTIVVLGQFLKFDGDARTLGYLKPVFVYLPTLVMFVRRPNIHVASESRRQAFPRDALDLTMPWVAITRSRVVLLAAVVVSSAFPLWITVSTRRL